MSDPSHGNAANPVKATSYELVNTIAKVAQMIDAVSVYTTVPPSLYIDLEGNNLCRPGTVSIIQIYLATLKHTYVVDFRTLGHASFSTPGSNNMTLKDIFESGPIPKVLFDVRNDSDALFHHFSISLAGIQYLQLMEFATRKHTRKFIRGLAKCIAKDAALTTKELVEWKNIKQNDHDHHFFFPECGGGYEVFDEQPLSSDILSYCVRDVHYLPRLQQRLHKSN